MFFYHWIWSLELTYASNMPWIGGASDVEVKYENNWPFHPIMMIPKGISVFF